MKCGLSKTSKKYIMDYFKDKEYAVSDPKDIFAKSQNGSSNDNQNDKPKQRSRQMPTNL